MELATGHSVVELEWEHGEERVKIKRGVAFEVASQPVAVQTVHGPQPVAAAEPPPEATPTPVPAQPAPRPEKPVPAATKTEEVTSPMVGTFYSRARPEAPAFVEKGDVVEPGQTLCIVEAMKLMNEIQAEKKCRVIDLLVQDGESVEYGQPLLLIEPQ
jgi:acetyl-CoA carboxylase biotin carboxyl carrier protein